jgi:hypothetical protein
MEISGCKDEEANSNPLKIPTELVLAILEWIADPKTLFAISRVSKFFRHILLAENKLWEIAFQNYWGHYAIGIVNLIYVCERYFRNEVNIQRKGTNIGSFCKQNAGCICWQIL